MICPTCHGVGWRRTGKRVTVMPEITYGREPCSECGGSGRVSGCDEAGAGIAEGGESRPPATD